MELSIIQRQCEHIAVFWECGDVLHREGRIPYTMKPMLDPERDLKGATPETLARALFRRIVPLCPPRPRRKAVVRDKAVVGKVATDQAVDGASHLRERV